MLALGGNVKLQLMGVQSLLIYQQQQNGNSYTSQPWISGYDTQAQVTSTGQFGITHQVIAVLDAIAPLVGPWDNAGDPTQPTAPQTRPIGTGGQGLGQSAVAGDNWGLYVVSAQAWRRGKTGVAFGYAGRAVGTYTWDITNEAAPGIVVRTGTGGTAGNVTIEIMELDSSGAGASFVLLASAAIGTNASNRLRIYPGLITAANVLNDAIGSTIRIRATVAGVSHNFGTDYSLAP